MLTCEFRETVHVRALEATQPEISSVLINKLPRPGLSCFTLITDAS